jgi:hypothetical protein
MLSVIMLNVVMLSVAAVQIIIIRNHNIINIFVKDVKLILDILYLS